MYGADTTKARFFAGGDCGKASSIDLRKPIYWYSDANQMARYRQGNGSLDNVAFCWDEKDNCWFDMETMCGGVHSSASQ